MSLRKTVCVQFLPLLTTLRTQRDTGRIAETSQVSSPYWPHIARYCDTIAAIPHIARYLLREVSTAPKWCDIRPWYLVLHRHICAIPHSATSRAIIVRYPVKQARKNFAILSPQVSAQYEKYRCCASQVSSPILFSGFSGPLSRWPLTSRESFWKAQGNSNCSKKHAAHRQMPLCCELFLEKLKSSYRGTAGGHFFLFFCPPWFRNTAQCAKSGAKTNM